MKNKEDHLTNKDALEDSKVPLTKNEEINTSNPLHKRGIKSYVLRAGRMSAIQKKAFQSYYDRYVLNDQQIQTLSHVFLHSNPIVCTIGFGMGDALLIEAKNNPDKNYFGIEVHPPGVGALLEGIVRSDLPNILIAHRDAKSVIDLLPVASIHTWQIFFPDPWPKHRHHKRRLIQDDFLNTIAQKTEQQGQLHIATDWADYAEHCQTVLIANTYWENTRERSDPHYPYLPINGCYQLREETKYEKRGKRLGHTIFDLLYKLVAVKA
jgi:tRNA (guanine-N7-)-methyltransferase